jgi:hypothetical protein
MLDGLRRWLPLGERRSPELATLARWAEGAGYAFKPVRDGAGGVIEASRGPRAWRIEWGESQRSYIPGPEVRLIAEPADLPRDLQILVLNRELAEALERAMFEQAMNDAQTRIDAGTPPEARWLVLHPKLEAAELGELRLRYAAAGNSPQLIGQWLASPLGEALTQTLPDVASTEPVALTVGRGRVLLRAAMTTPTADRLSLWQDVFAAALEQLPEIGQAWREADRRSRPVDTVLPSRHPDGLG